MTQTTISGIARELEASRATRTRLAITVRGLLMQLEPVLNGRTAVLRDEVAAEVEQLQAVQELLLQNSKPKEPKEEP
jgi:hypothetical protein